MPRPHMSRSIVELEADFAQRRQDSDFLRTLAAELAHRQTQRAGKLATQVAIAAAALKTVSVVASLLPSPKGGSSQTEDPAAKSPPRDPTPFPPIANRPADILSAWTAIEVLSPAQFDKPEDVAGQRTAVADLGPELPWRRGERSQPKKRMYYQVVLGAIALPAAFEALATVFADSRPERPRTKAYAPLAVLTLDKEGRPVEDDAASVASFGWGVPVAMADGVAHLADWRHAETDLAKRLAEQVRVLDATGRAKPLDRVMIDTAFAWLVATLGLEHELVRPPWFAVRKYVHIASKQPPESVILNSLILDDLVAARELAVAERLPQLLERFVGAKAPQARRDLLGDRGALTAALAPARVAPARWPGADRHPLVLLQQAAVNLARAEACEAGGGGMLAVNGPPGTGKTTLLRDLIAGLVADRAEAMLAFDDPADAFEPTKFSVKSGGEEARLHRLDPRLRGFEMIVASSNNGAVDNVSTEIPTLKAIAADAPELRYFKSLSDSLFATETWGLAAAALGKGDNRYKFSQAFWKDEDQGMAAYLAAASGGWPQVVRDGTPRTPKIVEREHPPQNHEEALARWSAAREAFKTALARSRAALAELEVTRRAAVRVPELQTALKTWEAGVLAQPGFWSRLFATASARAWRAAHRASSAGLELAIGNAEGIFDTKLLAALRGHMAKPWAQPIARARDGQVLDTAAVGFEQRRRALGERFVDAAFFDRDRAAVQTASPWLDAQTQRLRDDVFVAAMNLHAAFIGAAARPLIHNLSAMMRVLWMGDLQDSAKNALLPDLWSSLFLAVPVISTTFASVNRMLGALPPESLGWVLIDEAGQAPPQAAVGALLRVRNAVVVGDPVQIEPVVTMPESLTSAIHRRHGVDPDAYGAPAASVQTRADAATPYMAEFMGPGGSRIVGAPLLVHRRCDEPMFSIANAIAYRGLMVQAKTPEPSDVIAALGPSAWFDVEGRAADKWSPDEGEVVLALLRGLRDKGLPPDCYVLSPFRLVADRMSATILRSGVLTGFVPDPGKWCRERVGTVHTAQGREDRAVILVLGAPLPEQAGARNWAGGRPNLLNVAVTRAKEAVYVVGSRRVWRNAGVFAVLAERLGNGALPAD